MLKTISSVTKKSVLAFGLMAAGTVSALAAVDPAIQAAFQGASDDAVTVVGYVALALVAFVAAFWIIKAIRSGK